MKAWVTVAMENLGEVRAALRGAGRPPPGRMGSVAPLPEALVGRMGGRLLHVDLDLREVVEEIELPTPGGLAWVGDLLHVASMWQDDIHVVDPLGRRRVARYSDPAFNDVHTLSAVGDRLLVASTGVDAVVEMVGGVRTRAWWPAPGLTALGRWRQVDPHHDHRGQQYPTLDRVLHLNSALAWDGRILGTSFHNGEVLEITDRGALTLFRGLDHPHALAPGPAPDLLMCSESPRGAVRLIDGRTMTDRGTVSFGGRWLQAAACVGGRLVGLDNPHFGAGRRAEGPSRILELRDGALRTVLELPGDWRLFGVLGGLP